MPAWPPATGPVVAGGSSADLGRGAASRGCGGARRWLEEGGGEGGGRWAGLGSARGSAALGAHAGPAGRAVLLTRPHVARIGLRKPRALGLTARWLSPAEDGGRGSVPTACAGPASPRGGEASRSEPQARVPGLPHLVRARHVARLRPPPPVTPACALGPRAARPLRPLGLRPEMSRPSPPCDTAAPPRAGRPSQDVGSLPPLTAGRDRGDPPDPWSWRWGTARVSPRKPRCLSGCGQCGPPPGLTG